MREYPNSINFSLWTKIIKSLVALIESPKWLLFGPKFWEVAGTNKWWLCHWYIQVEWWGHSVVVETLRLYLPVVIKFVRAFCTHSSWER